MLQCLEKHWVMNYAITAVVGRKSVMESAQSTFISSTFGLKESGQLQLLLH